jgi:Tol biopolymer transport system component
VLALVIALPLAWQAAVAETPGVTTRASVVDGTTDGQGDDRSEDASISAEGQFVAFASAAGNLVAGDANGESDVFVRDRETSTTTLVSVLPGGRGQFPGRSTEPSISADGTVVAFTNERYPPTLIGGSLEPPVVPIPTPTVPIPTPTITILAVPEGPAQSDDFALSVVGAPSGPVPTGSVRFFLCAPSELDPFTGTCAFGGQPVGDAIPLEPEPDPDPPTATAVAPPRSAATPPVLLTEPGQWCWRAAYSGDDAYRAAVGLDREENCFFVSRLDPLVDSFAVFGDERAADVAIVTGIEPFEGGGGTPTGTVDFFLCGPDAPEVTAAGCIDGGRPVPPTMQLGESEVRDQAVVTSSFTEVTEPGRYCWRFEYSGDGNYLPAVHTDTAAQCFTVATGQVAVVGEVDDRLVVGGQPLGVTARIIPIEQRPRVRLEKFGPESVSVDPSEPGSTLIEYQFAVTNTGNTRLVSVLVTDPMLDMAVDVGELAPGQTERFEAPDPYSVTGDDADAGVVTNSATVVAETESGSFARDTATHTVILQEPALSLDKLGPELVFVGDVINYEFIIVNTGNVPLTDVYILDPSLTSDRIFVADLLAPGERESVERQRIAPSTDAPLVNTATVFGTAPDGFETSTSDSHTVTVLFEVGAAPASSGGDGSTFARRSSRGGPALAALREPGTFVLAAAPLDTVQFVLCGPGEVTSHGCVTGGTPVGDPLPLGEEGIVVLPPVAAPTAPGTYCWRIEYGGSADVAAVDHTDASSLCFEVAGPAPVPNRDVYVHDRGSGATTLVSVAADGGPGGPPRDFGGTADSYEPAISADGLHVAFTSLARNLTGTPYVGEENVFVRDLTGGVTTLVSVVDPACAFPSPVVGAVPCFDRSFTPTVSANGQVVGFASAGRIVAVNPVTEALFVSDGSNEIAQVFVRDMATGRTTVESIANDGTIGLGRSMEPSISGDGTRVAFASDADNLVTGLLGGVNVLVRDRAALQTIQASVTTLGEQAVSVVTNAEGTVTNPPVPAVSREPALSLDGRTVAFVSDATNLAVEATPQCVGQIISETLFGPCGSQVYVRDLVRSTTTIVSVDDAGTPAGATSDSRRPAVSRNGRWVAYDSDATNLVAGDTNAEGDVFVRDRTPLLSIVPDPLNFAEHVVGTASAPQVITATNIGSGPLDIASATLTAGDVGDFELVTDTCTGVELRRLSTCVIEVVFRPAAEGPRTALLSFATTAPGTPQTVRLTGIGTVGRLAVDPVPVDFGEQTVETTSDPRVLSLVSVGTAAVTVDAVTIQGANAGDFLVAAADDACSGQVLLVGRGCAVVIRFRPTAEGARAAEVRIVDTATGSPRTVPLLGVGVRGALTAAPDPIDFGVVARLDVSAPQVVTVTNQGSGVAGITGVTFTGATPGEFQVTEDGCSGQALAPLGGTCTVTLVLDPTTTGAPAAVLEVGSDTPGSPLTVQLRGLVPQLVTDPALGRPGFVTELRGAHFPGETLLILEWVPGLGRELVRTRADGTFTTRMMILPRDMLGPRVLEARGVDSQEQAFRIGADFLVVAGTAQPGDFVTRR